VRLAEAVACSVIGYGAEDYESSEFVDSESPCFSDLFEEALEFAVDCASSDEQGVTCYQVLQVENAELRMFLWCF
jgi:hypothetical protein